jgi:hypothetical protein
MPAKRIWKFLIYISLFLFLLSACGIGNKKPLDIGDGGLLSGNPCSAPCFWGITPGITPEKQALTILSSKLNVKGCDRWDTRISGGTRGIDCSDINIGFDDQNYVNGIGFSPSKNISLNDVIRKYGNPDGIFVIATGIEGTSPLVALIYFDNVNMIIHLPDQNSISYDLQSDIIIERIVYLERSDYEFNKRSAQQWKGFGKY